MADVVVVGDDADSDTPPVVEPDPAPILVTPPAPIEPDPEPAGETAAAVAETARAVSAAVAEGVATDRTPEILTALAAITSRLDVIESREAEPAPEILAAEDAEDVAIEDTPPNRRHRWFQSVDELRGR